MAHEELSVTNERQAGVEVDQERLKYLARGLGRSSTVGRRPGGLPITARAIELEQLTRASRDEQVTPQGELESEGE